MKTRRYTAPAVKGLIRFDGALDQVTWTGRSESTRVYISHVFTPDTLKRFNTEIFYIGTMEMICFFSI